MKNITKNFKAVFIDFISVKAKNPYNGDGFIDVYWFELEQSNGYTTLLSYTLDYTYELWEPKYEYWAVIQPLQSYKTDKTDKNLLGTECMVSAEVEEHGFPISIDSILMSDSKTTK